MSYLEPQDEELVTVLYNDFLDGTFDEFAGDIEIGTWTLHIFENDVDYSHNDMDLYTLKAGAYILYESPEGIKEVTHQFDSDKISEGVAEFERLRSELGEGTYSADSYIGQDEYDKDFDR